MIAIVVFLLLIYNCNTIFSQHAEGIKELEKIAERHWANENYKLSKQEYEKLIKLDPNNFFYKYRFAISNFLAGFNIDTSLKYIEPLLGKNHNFSDVPFWIGKMYMHSYRFNDAIDMFNTYIASSGISQKNIEEAQKLIENCLNALDLLNKPLNVTFENLGANINSSSNEILPFTPYNEDFLIFTSDKSFDHNSMNFDENIYISFPDGLGWKKCMPVSGLNTQDPEKVVGMSTNGDTLFVCGHYGRVYSDVNIALTKNRVNYKYIEGEKFFSKYANKFTTGATITADGQTLYFSAERNDSYGKNDIYVIKKLPNGEWSQPQNLGNTINTPEDEIYPQISPDGKTLYFASKGHKSIGDYDIFKTTYNDEKNTWNKPENLGYPINTPGADYSICFSPTKKYAYVASVRKEGFGGTDIYKIIFNNENSPVTILKGQIYLITDKDTIPWKPTLGNVEITIYDNYSNVYGIYAYNYNLFRFIAALPPAEYTIKIYSPICNLYTEKIIILDRSNFVKEIEKKFYLKIKK
ncbi:MAG: hypothetical protein N3A01_01765 [Bacteroidales bacterium]|nr:hypothetical protein [Bacteroidales bacterium]